MVSCSFSFVVGEQIIWLAPNTRSIYAKYLGVEVKADGNQWVKIQPMPGLNDAKYSGDAMFVLADQVIPAFD